MKLTCVVEGAKLNLKVNEVSRTYDERGQVTSVAVNEVANFESGISKSSTDLEMNEEEYKHLETTVKETVVNFRETVVPKIFAVLDNLVLLADKKLPDAEIWCKRTGGTTTMTEEPAPAGPAS